MEVAAPENWYLRYEGHAFTRLIFFWTGMGLFCTLGMAYYSFPLWLNQIVVDYVDLSRAELSFLGGMSYISLGLSGGFVILSKKLELPAVTEFNVLTCFFAGCGVLPWILLYWLVSTEHSTVGHTPVMVGFILLLQGFSAGAFYAIWGKYVLSLMKQKYETYIIVMMNLSFPTGSVLLMSLKFYLGNQAWVRMVLIIQCVFFGWLLFFSVFFGQYCLILPKNIPPSRAPSFATAGDNVPPLADPVGNLPMQEPCGAATRPSTGQMLMELFMGRRKNKGTGLLGSRTGDITSYQFYFILMSYMLFNCVATAFMANIGPLTSHSDDDQKSKHEQLTILISANTGQTIGRCLYPIIFQLVIRLYNPAENSLSTRAYEKLVFAGRTTRSCLGQTILVSLVFIVCLLILRLYSDAQYIYAFTAISVGYGMMWVIVTNYPSFFAGYDFEIVSSFLMCAGSISTLAIVAVISMLKLSNDAIFTTLLVGSIWTVIAAGIAMHDRIANESEDPKAAEVYLG